MCLSLIGVMLTIFLNMILVILKVVNYKTKLNIIAFLVRGFLKQAHRECKKVVWW